MLAATLPSGFSETLLPGTANQPTSTVVLPDGRLLVTQKNGELRMFKNGGLVGTPAMTLAVDTSGERGLESVTIDPKFASNHYIYVTYFRPNKGYGQVSRFTLDGDTVKADSELVLIGLSPQTNPSHSSGSLQFGGDGKLYIAVGDNEEPSNSQSFATLHGKLLRINSDGSIPQNNPFYGTLTSKYRAIYAIGLRNPFTTGADPVSGKVFINDVGAKAFEEINQAKAGANYGWPKEEGPGNGDPADAGYTDPIYAYPPPAVGVGVSVCGGAFYTAAQQFPDSFKGKYFFGDYVQGFVQTLDPATKTASPFATGFGKVIDLDVAADGTLLVTTYDGRVHAIAYKKTTPPPPPGDASYSGYVVNDINRNAKWDSGEKGIGGRTVWIDLDNDGQIDRNEPTAVTADNGKFTFTGLAAGTYKVREVIPTGWNQTYPTNNFGLNATLAAGQAKSGASFQVTRA